MPVPRSPERRPSGFSLQYAENIRIIPHFSAPSIQEFTWPIAHKRESVQDRTQVSATVISSLRSELRTAIKHVRKAISSSDKTNAQSVFRASVATIDSIADKGIIHKNKAARHKSRLSAAIKTMV